MRWVAFIPLRGGSKSIPDKNIKRIAGRPLFAWSLEQAILSGAFDEIYVSTDSEKIRASVLTEFPEGVKVIERSAETSSDTASTESAMLEFQQQVEFDVICLIQATSPLSKAQDFRDAKQKFIREELDSLVSTVNSKRFFWNDNNEPVNYDPQNRPRHQDFKGWQMENGAFYMSRAEILKEQASRLGGRIGVYEMAQETAVEIDEEVDWLIVEQLLLKQKQGLNRTSPIKVLVVDVDGTLTDAGMYYGPDGEALKKFNTRDAHGMLRLRDLGVILCVITAETSPSVAARMKKLKIDEYYPGVKDKLPLLQDLVKQWDVSLEDVAYVGDDLGDLECITHVGASFCPADAVPEVLREADYICKNSGGKDAVREVCNLIFEINNSLKH